MCRFGPIIGILIRARLLFGCRLRAYRAAEGLHGSTQYPQHHYAMGIPERSSRATAYSMDIEKDQQKKRRNKKIHT